MKRHGSMNHIYRLVWSHAVNGWVAVAETARGRGKGSGRKLIAAALSLTAVGAQAGPSGGQVVSGAGGIAQSGLTTTVTQASQNLTLNWNSFNISPQETVNFVQPSASAIAVNRIVDTNGSQILGRLNANGQVFLINPNGILFGQGARVNVGGLVASTPDLNDAAQSGTTRSFGGNGPGSVVNQGTITATGGGYVALLGNHVGNQGVITAQLGSVALGAGSAATLTFSGNSLLHMQVDQSVLNSLAENGGLIRADGGMVVMTAGAKDALLASVVNNSGVIEARTVDGREGTITLLGGMTAGTVNAGGTLDASAPHGGNGGFIETSAASVMVADGAKVTTAASMGLAGSWLIDPVDFTVAATGGDMSGAALSASLSTTPVTIASTGGASGTSGNVNVNDAVTWSANMLTLSAQNNININATLNGSGTASLVLIYGQSSAGGSGANYFVNAPVNLPTGNNFSTQLGTGGTVINYTVINSVGVATDAGTGAPTLQGMILAGNYALGSNIDATSTSGWNSNKGFTPVGSAMTQPEFSGNFDGLGHTISNLTIDLPLAGHVALFGGVSGASAIRNVGMVGGSVTGGSYVGGLVGENYGSISNSYATGNVTGSAYAGGLVGKNYGTISSSHATGGISGHGNHLGGLAGGNYTGTITNSYATGAVTGTNSSQDGGLVGYSYGGSITNSYATGAVTASHQFGGLVGLNRGALNDSYASGAVAGNNSSKDGGLVGDNYGTISNSYATGKVSGPGCTYVGGLVGLNHGGGTISNSFWDISTTDQPTAGVGEGATIGAIGMTTGNMQIQTNFTASTNANNHTSPTWDFNNTWAMYSGYTYPLLQSFMTPLTVTVAAANGAKTYDGLGYSIANGVTYSTLPNSNLLGTLIYTSGSQPVVNAGVYSSIAPAGLYSNQQGYIIGYSYAGGATLTVNPAALTITAGDASKVYGATPILTAFTSSGLKNGETIGSVTEASFGTAGNASVAGGAYPIVLSAATGGTFAAANYAISYANGSMTVIPAALTITAADSCKIYGATPTLTAFTSSGLQNGETIGSVTEASIGTVGTASVAGGPYAIVPSAAAGGTFAASNYAISYASASLTVAPAPLTITGLSGSERNYNGTTMDPLAGTASLSGLVNGETLVLGNTASGTLAGANAGSEAVSTAITLANGSGLSANYVLTQPTLASVTIAQAPLTVTGLAGTDRVYSGGMSDALTGTTRLSGLVNGQSLTLGNTGSGTLASANAGSEAVTAAITLANGTGLAANYILSQPTLPNVTVAPAPLTVTGESAASKVYNGTTGAALSGGSLTGVISGDAVTLTEAGSFASKNVGGGAVTATDGLSGSGAGNYTLMQPTGLTANITPATLTVTGESAASKVFDGTTTAVLSGGSLTGVTSGDTVTLTQAGSFASKNVGTGIAVTAADSLGGPSAGNYALTQPTIAQANIASPGVLTANAVTALESLPPFSGMNTQLTMLKPIESIGEADVSLQVVDGGVKLPDNLINLSE